MPKYDFQNILEFFLRKSVKKRKKKAFYICSYQLLD